jgi:hypothetical protein
MNISTLSIMHKSVMQCFVYISLPVSLFESLYKLGLLNECFICLKMDNPKPGKVHQIPASDSPMYLKCTWKIIQEK